MAEMTLTFDISKREAVEAGIDWCGSVSYKVRPSEYSELQRSTLSSLIAWEPISTGKSINYALKGEYLRITLPPSPVSQSDVPTYLSAVHAKAHDVWTQIRREREDRVIRALSLPDSAWLRMEDGVPVGVNCQPYYYGQVLNIDDLNDKRIKQRYFEIQNRLVQLQEEAMAKKLSGARSGR